MHLFLFIFKKLLTILIFIFERYYMKKLSEENVERVNYILPNHLHIVEQFVDEDEDCGELWNYLILRK